jgi:hypothetical protein
LAVPPDTTLAAAAVGVKPCRDALVLPLLAERGLEILTAVIDTFDEHCIYYNDKRDGHALAFICAATGLLGEV